MSDQSAAPPPQEVPPDPSIPLEAPPEPTPDPIGDAMKALMDKIGALEASQVRYRQGTVTALTPLSVALGASDVAYTNVSVLGGPDLAVGDPVACLVFGNDMLVIGSVGTQVEPALSTGAIVASPLSSLGPGFLLCNGQSTAGYPALAAKVGANVPDLRGRYVTGVTSGRASGSVAGASTVTLTIANLPAHTHAVADHTHPLAAHTHTIATHSHTMAHTHSFTTSTDGSHTHTYTRAVAVSGQVAQTGGFGAFYSGGSADSVSSGGSHNHSGTTGASSAASTGVGGPTATGSGGPTVTGADGPGLTGSVGSGTGVSTEGPNMALNFFIKT